MFLQPSSQAFHAQIPEPGRLRATDEMISNLLLSGKARQAHVSVVECPGCGRAWTLSPGGGVLRFKAQPRRKTNTPATSRRWTRGKDETDWDVVGGSTLPMRQISEKLTGQRGENEGPSNRR